uniref:Calmodulin-lysine N-methyltransferase n=1 Tax=Brassica oleracea var. oleracea TaxID=109376 RepID=A0A0D3EAV9_BRAOL
MEECFVTAARRSIAGGGGEAITTLPMDPTSSSSSPLRWRILRQALIIRSADKEWIIAVISMTEISNRHNIDNTGLVCQWPSEEVLAYLCMSQPDCFRGKRVIELGSGYGLAGLVIAAATEASEVVVSDENPQVVNCLWTVPCLLGFIVVLNNPYIKRNIESISMAFYNTSVKAWSCTGTSINFQS